MQHPITIMGSTALSPRSPKKVTFASRTNPANHAAKVKTVAQPYPIITRPFITIRLACSLVWVYHTAWQKTTAICQNSPFFPRTYGHTQRLTRNAQYRGMQSKRQDTTVMVILCLCLSRFSSCTATTKKILRPNGLAASFLVDIPTRWEPRTNQSNGLR